MRAHDAIFCPSLRLFQLLFIRSAEIPRATQYYVNNKPTIPIALLCVLHGGDGMQSSTAVAADCGTWKSLMYRNLNQGI